MPSIRRGWCLAASIARMMIFLSSSLIDSVGTYWVGSESETSPQVKPSLLAAVLFLMARYTPALTLQVLSLDTLLLKRTASLVPVADTAVGKHTAPQPVLQT